MPKKGHKKDPYISFACSDVKLSDFADGQASALRRKPLVNSLAREVKTLCSLERKWYTEENTSFDDDDDDDASEDNSVVEHHGRKRRNKTHRKTEHSESDGRDYPLDLWFILSEYIKPEDVKTFSLLCKSSYRVCQTYIFWINLYKRYYCNTEQNLPQRLQPRCIERPYCLKACVVRSLYYLYPEFSKKVSSPCTGNIYNLIKFVCISMWRSQKNGKWLFCFKFRSQQESLQATRKVKKSEENRSWAVWDSYDYTPQVLLEDVNTNPEEGCKILQVTCPNFIAAPVVMGGHLADIRVTCAQDMIKQKLQLTFSFSNYKQPRKNMPSLGSRDCGGNGEILVFEPVENMLIMDWWHPQYPSFPS